MDENTYLQLAGEYARSLYRISRAILGSDADSADAVQQAVFRGWQMRRQLRDREKFRPWLMRILVNECRNLQRKNMKQARIMGALEMRAREPEPPDRHLSEAIGELPEKYRLPVLLHYMEGYSVREIAKILEIPEKRVTDQLYRARKKLEEALKR